MNRKQGEENIKCSSKYDPIVQWSYRTACGRLACICATEKMIIRKVSDILRLSTIFCVKF